MTATRRTLVAVLVVVAAAGAIAIGIQWAVSRSATHRVSAAIHRLTERRGAAVARARAGDSVAIRLRECYRARGNRPAWVDGAAPTPRAAEVLRALRSAADVGLDPTDYPVSRLATELHAAHVAALHGSAHPESLARLDVELTTAFLTYARDRGQGRVDPRRLQIQWALRPRVIDWPAVLTAASGGGVDAALASLDPPASEYTRLREALARYRGIVAAGGWPAVPAGPPIAPGSHGARVTLLARRLAAEGDLPAARVAPRFDPAIAEALRRWQRRHGLEPTGRAGPEEIEALDVPAAARVTQIALNLERWRWIPGPFPDRSIVVNIPEYLMQIREGGRVARLLRVVVGKEDDPTPMFAATLTDVVFHPFWHVPPSIAMAELADSITQRPDYLGVHHMRVYRTGRGIRNGAQEVDPREVDWKAAANGDFDYSIRQEPGPDNALGQVKFLLPNPFNVYFHDTPAGHLFGRRERDFSHGCIRVERPAELATYLLADKPGWDSTTVAAALDSTDTRTVRVPRPIPVTIVYFTAWVDEAGVAQFRNDVYAVDDFHADALRRRPARRGRPPEAGIP